jgi:hypothetical protein
LAFLEATLTWAFISWNAYLTCHGLWEDFMSWNAYCIPCTYIIYCISLVYLPCYMGLLCLGMLTILCLYYIYYSCTYMACDTWCACHAYWGFYFLKCLSYALLYLLSIYWLGVLAMLIGAFMSCNAYFMPYYIYQ